MYQALIGWSQAKRFPWYGEFTMLMHFPKSGENPVVLRNPQTSAQMSGMDPSHRNGG